MNTNQPLVSIVTPVYNGSKYLEELIRSVQEQDYPNIEQIIIDDGSTDGGATVSILKRFPHLRWWSRPNKGAYATMNEGLASARGELVTVICADDKYASRDAISAAVRAYRNDGKCDGVFGDTLVIAEDSTHVDYDGPRTVPLWLYRYYPQVVAHCSLLVNRAKLVQEGLVFDESLPYAADMDWIMKMFAKGFRLRRLRKPIALNRHHPEQRGEANDPIRVKEEERLSERYGKKSILMQRLLQAWVRTVVVKNIIVRRGAGHAISEILRRFKRGKAPSLTVKSS